MNHTAVVVGLGRFVLSSQLASAGDHTIGSSFENGTVSCLPSGICVKCSAKAKREKHFQVFCSLFAENAERFPEAFRSFVAVLFFPHVILVREFFHLFARPTGGSS